MDIDVIVERKSFDMELEVGNPVVEVKAPDHYNGPFDIFPSDEDQIIPVKDKTPAEDIVIKAIKTDPYEGATTVTPSDERQTLPTRGKYLSNNVVINPIPSNYGKISWNGSVLIVS